MTASEAKALARITGSVFLALATPILIALLVGAWSSKESVADHNADIARISADVQRILDVVCEGKAVQARACK